MVKVLSSICNKDNIGSNKISLRNIKVNDEVNRWNSVKISECEHEIYNIMLLLISAHI